jgi:hypothetical protein
MPVSSVNNIAEIRNRLLSECKFNEFHHYAGIFHKKYEAISDSHESFYGGMNENISLVCTVQYLNVVRLHYCINFRNAYTSSV